MLTLVYSQLIFCTIAYNFIYKGALGLSQLSFFLWYPLPLCSAFLISISFAPIFPFPQRYLHPCYAPALFTPVHSLVFFLTALHSIFCSFFCSSSSFEGAWTLDVLPWNLTILYFSLQTLVPGVEVTLIQVSPLAMLPIPEASLNTFALQFYPCWGM